MTGDWLDGLTEDERAEWDQFVARTRASTVRQMDESAFVASLVPDEKGDIKFAVELGLAIMLDKPIIAIAASGRPVPRRLRKVADEVIEVADMDTEAGAAQIAARMKAAMRRIEERRAAAERPFRRNRPGPS